MDLGPHAPFIIGAYAAAGLVIAMLVGWVAVDFRLQRRTLAGLAARGIVRHSDMRERQSQGARVA